jgi:hypothetical protein
MLRGYLPQRDEGMKFSVVFFIRRQPLVGLSSI